MGDLANDGLKPDLTLLLDMPAEQAVKRMDGPADRMESRGIDYMESVRQAFLEQLTNSSPHTAIIDADRSPDEVKKDIVAAVSESLSL